MRLKEEEIYQSYLQYEPKEIYGLSTNAEKKNIVNFRYNREKYKQEINGGGKIELLTIRA